MACSAKYSMCSMKWTGEVSGAFAGAGTVRNVHCAVFRVQCGTCQRWKGGVTLQLSWTSTVNFGLGCWLCSSSKMHHILAQ